MRYAAFLRGINLGPNRRVAMADLRRAMTDAGYNDVATHLQSGNVVFSLDRSPVSDDELELELEALYRRSFEMEIPVVVRDGPALQAISDGNPYQAAADQDPTKVHIVFVQPPPRADAWKDFDARPHLPDEVSPGPGVAYMHLPNGMARSKLLSALESVLRGSKVTTRNCRTVEAVKRLVDGA